MRLDRRTALSVLAAGVMRPIASAALEPPLTMTTLVAGEGKRVLRDKVETPVSAYNGQVPGPVIRVRKGAEVRVRLVNTLAQPTSLCWHGVRIANAMDGVAGLTQPPVMPGESFDYRFTPPDSGTYWYHPHAWPFSGEQIERGLFGALIVDESDPVPADADLLVMLKDWALDGQGRLKGAPLDGPGRRDAAPAAAFFTINGKPVPDRHKAAPASRLRLRLVNACGARVALVRFAGLRPTVIAIDGQPSELFEPANATLPIGPGSRFDVMVDMPAQPPSAPPTPALMLVAETGSEEPLLVFDVAGSAVPSRGAVSKLPANPLLPVRIPLEASRRVSAVLAAAVGGGAPPPANPGLAPHWSWSIEGRSGDGASGPPLFTVRRGSAVTLTLINRTTEVQQMHVHGHVFRLLHDLDDGWDPYWRESVLLAPGKTKHLAFVADNPGRWVVESLTLERQIAGLASHFVVT